MSNANERCPACGEATLRFFRKVGKYRCINDDCGEEFLPDQLHAAPHADADGLDLDSLPFPVAYPLAHARDSRLPAPCTRPFRECHFRLLPGDGHHCAAVVCVLTGCRLLPVWIRTLDSRFFCAQ